MGCPNVETLHSLVGGATLQEDREELLAHVDTCDACHAAMIALIRPDAVKPSPVREAATDIGRYKVERKLGAGGMGVVFLAHDPELDRKIAVKLMRDPRGTDATERLRREARALAALSHPNVVAVYDVGEHAGQMYVAMEYVDGGSVRGWLSLPRTWREVVQVIIAAARGLSAAHAANLVHRDIKPENLLMGNDGRVRVSDFGLASIDPVEVDGSLPAESLTQTGALMGTPPYMSPEQIYGEETDARSDQYSLCATAFEAVYGIRPFAGKTITTLTAAIETGEPAEVDESRAPAWLRRVIMRGLAVKPADRWPSLDALIAALESGMKRRSRMVAAGVLGVAIAGAALIAWQVTKPAARSCGGIGDVHVAAWSPLKLAQLHALLVANNTDIAAVEPRVIDWFDGWSAAITDACRVDEPSIAPRRRACFVRALAGTEVVLDRLFDPDVDARNAAAIVERLPRLEHCSPTSVLGEPAPPPQELALRVQDIERQVMQIEEPLFPQRALAKLGPLSAQADATNYPPLIARIKLARGRWLDDAGDRTGAANELRAAQHLAEANHDDFTAAQAAVALVSAVAGSDHLDDALRMADVARSAIARLGGAADLEAALEVNVAAAQNMAQHYTEAVAAFEKGCELHRTTYGDHSPTYAACLVMLANSLTFARREKEAAVIRAKAEKLITTLYGVRPELEIAEAIATSQARLGLADPAGALAADERGLQLVKRLQPNGRMHGELENGLALDNALLGKRELAFQHYGNAAVIWEQLGSQLELAYALDNQADAGFEIGHAVEAIAAERRAIAIYEANLSPATELDYAAALNTLALALIETGDLGGARTPAEHALAIREKRNAQANQRGSSRFALAQALWVGDANDKRRAIDLARGAATDLRAFIAKFDANDPMLAMYRRRIDPRIAKIDAWLASHR